MVNIEFNSIKAKKSRDRFQSLEEHTEWVVREAMKLIDEKSILKVSQLTGFSIDWIKELIFFSAYYHDIGKATIEFQKRIGGEKIEAYHSLYSFYLTYYIDKFDIEYGDEQFINILSLTVLTHHQTFKDHIFSSKSSKFQPLKETKEFFYNYQNLYREFFSSEPPEMNYPDDFDHSYLSEIKESVQYYKDGEKLRTLYSYVLGILNLADWIASAKFDGKEFDFSQKVEKLELSFELKSFQKSISEITSSALLEIPTGEGKTEASLLWALKNIRNSNSKIIYTLPTQTTSNKLFQRVEKLFGDVGLVHSSAKSYLETIYQNENGDVEWATPYTFTKLFSQPVTVSTLDALLKHFVNIGRYPIATLNYINSVVIIDEVHSYDFKFLGFLKRFLEISEKFGVKTLLMSASIPNILKRKLEIENLPTVTDKKLFEKVANRIEKRETLLIDDIKSIVSDYNRGKKVLVIVNQVKRAVEIYKALENVENKTLFHSQFKKGDRAKKESEIFEVLNKDTPYILVATQIVEISLDIDFEVLYTEIAPIDSLIQRFGRVNRQKDKNRIGDIFIYQTENPKPYEDIPIKYAFETVENGLFPISRYIEWLNIYYVKLLDGDKGFQTDFQDSFQNGYSKFDEVLKKPISENRDYNVRDIEIPTEDFLLKKDFEEEKIDFNKTVSLPSSFAKNYLYAERDSYAKNYWRTLNFKYSYELGVIFEKEENRGD